MPLYKIYRPDERPDVEVLVGDTWCPGELRAWARHNDETWTGDVQYRRIGEHSSYLGTFTHDQIREDETDRSGGRKES